MKNADKIKEVLGLLCTDKNVTLKDLESLEFKMRSSGEDVEVRIYDDFVSLTVCFPLNVDQEKRELEKSFPGQHVSYAEATAQAREFAIDSARQFVKGTTFTRDDDNVVGDEIMITFSNQYNHHVITDLKILLAHAKAFLEMRDL